jgi:NAD(P)-dependent dehydrogenase (short-subunit alcohol dehydrogenase family)
MRTLVAGASKGLGRALIEGVGEAGDTLMGVSPTRPENLMQKAGVHVRWVEANLGESAKATPLTAFAVSL